MREEQHVADRRGVGEEHDEAVDADAAAGGRGQAVLEGADVVGVVVHGFVVTVALRIGLGLEAGGLIVRVVELGEAVAEFSAGDEELEAFRHVVVGVGGAGERGDLRRIVDDEGRLDELGFGRLLEEGHLQGAEADVVGLRLAETDEFGAQEGFVGELFGRVVGRVLEDGFNRGEAVEGLLEVDLMPLVGQDGGAGGFAGGRAEKVFRELHLVAVRPVRAVELHHRELGVVTDGDAFVAEVAVDFEDALEAAHDEALQIEFRRDAQVHVHVERIVVRDERLGVGAARNRVEHRRLDLEEAVREHEAADRGDGLGADEEAVAGVLVHDEVDVALAVAHFGVDETLVLVGQRTDVLRHEAKLMGTDGEFAGLRAEERALDGDDVAEVERLPGGIGFFADVALRDEVLHVAREVADGREARLAHDALEHHAAGAGHFGLELLELFGGGVLVLGADVAEEVRANEVVRIGDAGFAQGGEFGAALGDDVVFFFRQLLGGFLVLSLFGHFVFLW